MIEASGVFLPQGLKRKTLEPKQVCVRPLTNAQLLPEGMPFKGRNHFSQWSMVCINSALMVKSGYVNIVNMQEEKRSHTLGIRVTETEHADFINRPFEARRKITVALRKLLKTLLGLSK